MKSDRLAEHGYAALVLFHYRVEVIREEQIEYAVSRIVKRALFVRMISRCLAHHAHKDYACRDLVQDIVRRLLDYLVVLVVFRLARFDYRKQLFLYVAAHDLPELKVRLNERARSDPSQIPVAASHRNGHAEIISYRTACVSPQREDYAERVLKSGFIHERAYPCAKRHHILLAEALLLCAALRVGTARRIARKTSVSVLCVLRTSGVLFTRAVLLSEKPVYKNVVGRLRPRSAVI